MCAAPIDHNSQGLNSVKFSQKEELDSTQLCGRQVTLQHSTNQIEFSSSLDNTSSNKKLLRHKDSFYQYQPDKNQKSSSQRKFNLLIKAKDSASHLWRHRSLTPSFIILPNKTSYLPEEPQLKTPQKVDPSFRRSLNSPGSSSSSYSKFTCDPVTEKAEPKEELSIGLKEKIEEIVEKIDKSLKEEAIEEIIEKRDKSLEEAINANSFSLDNLYTLWINKKENDINHYIDCEVLKNSNKCKLFFETILPYLKQEGLFVAILTRVLERMDYSQIFCHRHILQTIKLEAGNSADLITFHMQRAYALALIDIYLENAKAPQSLENAMPPKSQAPLLCHFWFIPADFFLTTICQQAMKREEEDTVLLLQAANFLVSHSRWYPVAYQTLFDLHSSLKKFSLSGNAKVNEEKEKFLKAIQEALKQKSYVLPKTFNEVMGKWNQKTPSQWVNISKAISEHNVKDQMVNDFTWDLKKLEAQFLSSILPLEFAAKQRNQLELDVWRRLYTQYSNQLIHFVAAHILSYKDVKTRASCCEFYIRVIKRCFEIGNLNTAHSLIGTFGNHSISRLKETWKHIKEKSKNNLEKKESIFCNLSNYKNYHAHIQKWNNKHKIVNAQNCLIPHFGIILRNFTFVPENETHLPDGRLNSEKIFLLAEQHTSFQKYQKQILAFAELLSEQYTYDLPYQLKRKDDAIQRYPQKFEDALEELVKRSESLEPPYQQQLENRNSIPQKSTGMTPRNSLKA